MRPGGALASGDAATQRRLSHCCCARTPRNHPSTDCTAPLLATNLLEVTRFDPELVAWLLDRGAVVAPAAPPSSTGSSGGTGTGSGGSGGVAGPEALPATALLLRKLARELQVSRQLSKLHAGDRSSKAPSLLRRAADPWAAPTPAGRWQQPWQSCSRQTGQR